MAIALSMDLSAMKTRLRVSSCFEDLHTPQPEGYVAWHKWAEEKAKTHAQVRCPYCELYEIWIPKEWVDGDS